MRLWIRARSPDTWFHLLNSEIQILSKFYQNNARKFRKGENHFCRARIRSKKGRIRGMSVKQTVSNLRKKAKKVIPTIKDINVIDQYSRIIFPLCFVIFNILYWGYYSLLVHRLSWHLYGFFNRKAFSSHNQLFNKILTQTGISIRSMSLSVYVSFSYSIYSWQKVPWESNFLLTKKSRKYCSASSFMYAFFPKDC